ncbi:MAG: hypothetical protein EXS32_11220, partial [Opitutus sp.]|nr:hypothetical protein [Opitutus sp.]
MKRRAFLSRTASAIALGALGPTWAAAGEASLPAATADLLRELIRLNDESIHGQLARQERRAGQRWLGGIPNEYGLPTASGTAGFVTALACALSAPGSKYFRSTELVAPLRLAVNYLRAA